VDLQHKASTDYILDVCLSVVLFRSDMLWNTEDG